MKDFFDVQKMSILFEFDGPTLVQAIRATFNRRKTSLPSKVPDAFTRAFALAKRTQWEAFIRRNALPDESFSGVVESLHEFLYRPLRAASRSEAFAENWNPGGPWSS
jgi:hypothetical protein